MVLVRESRLYKGRSVGLGGEHLTGRCGKRLLGVSILQLEAIGGNRVLNYQ